MILYFNLDGLFSFLPCKQALQNNITFPSPNDYQHCGCDSSLSNTTDFPIGAKITDLVTDSTTLWWFCSENKQGCENKSKQIAK